jgi:hypothetical protein
VRNCARLSYLGHLYLLAASRTSGRVNFWRAFSTESHPFARFKREFMPTCLYFQAQVQKRVKSIGFVVAWIAFSGKPKCRKIVTFHLTLQVATEYSMHNCRLSNPWVNFSGIKWIEFLMPTYCWLGKQLFCKPSTTYRRNSCESSCLPILMLLDMPRIRYYSWEQEPYSSRSRTRLLEQMLQETLKFCCKNISGHKLEKSHLMCFSKMQNMQKFIALPARCYFSKLTTLTLLRVFMLDCVICQRRCVCQALKNRIQEAGVS